jgi:hypothetical protein
MAVINTKNVLTNVLNNWGAGGGGNFSTNGPINFTINNVTKAAHIKANTFQVSRPADESINPNWYWLNSADKMTAITIHTLFGLTDTQTSKFGNLVNPIRVSEVFYFRNRDMAYLGQSTTQLNPTVSEIVKVAGLPNLTFWVVPRTPVVAPTALDSNSPITQNATCDLKPGTLVTGSSNVMSAWPGSIVNTTLATNNIPITWTYDAAANKLKIGGSGWYFRFNIANNTLDQMQSNLSGNNYILYKNNGLILN